MTRILLADDHGILRQGLRQVLAEDLPDAEFGEAGNAAEALAQLHAARWDVLVLDLNLPGRSGFEVLAEVRREFSALPVLVLSSTPEDQIGLRVLRAGAAGYLNKQVAPEQLVAAVQQVLKGERYVSPALAQRLAAELDRPASDRPRHEALSAREREVCQLAAAGKSLKEIASLLALSPKTIGTFRLRAFEKLGVKNDVELAHYAREHGLLEP